MNTDTDLETQDNTPLNSYDEREEEHKYLKKALNKDNDIIYHVNPERVIEANPDLAGKVKQAYIFCQHCQRWKNLTTENSMQLPFGEVSFQKE
jgi:hypothetical protein